MSRTENLTRGILAFTVFASACGVKDASNSSAKRTETPDTVTGLIATAEDQPVVQNPSPSNPTASSEPNFPATIEALQTANAGLENQETQTPTPSPTPTHSPTPNYPSTIEALEATNEALRREEEPEPLNPLGGPIFTHEPWTGETAHNNLRRIFEGPEVWERVFARWQNMYPKWKDGGQARKDNIARQDSTFSSLVNPFNPSQEFHSDPAQESGLGQTAEDFANYEEVGYLVDNRDGILMQDLYGVNKNGLVTMGVYGAGHDRDAITGILAAVYVDHFDPFEEGTTLGEALDDPRVDEIQDSMLAQIQERSLPVSQTEIDRRSGDEGDASADLPENLQESDQWQSCDVYRTDGETRQEQRQSTRGVNHVSQGQETFTEADSGEEYLLGVLAIDPETGAADFDAFTDRGYTPEINSATGEELLPCGPGAPVEETPAPGRTQVPPTNVPPTAAPSEIPPTAEPTNQPPTFTLVPPTNTPFSTPTNVPPTAAPSEIPPTNVPPTATRPRATENPTATAQPAEPTVTPGPTHVGTPTMPPTVENTPAQEPAATLTPIANSPTPFGN